MATLQTTETRPAGNSHADGKAYFETSTNQFIVWDATDDEWIQLDSDGTGAAPPFSDWSTSYSSSSATYLDLSAARSVLDATSQFSISFWFKYTSFTSKGVLWSSGAAGNNLSACWYNNGNLVFTVRDGQGAHPVYATVSAPSLNTWAHMVCVFDAGQGTSYITPTDTGVTASDTKSFVYNGTPVSATHTNGGQNLRTGLFSHASVQGLDGNIDDVAIWDSALSASDVATIYGSGKPSNISSLSPSAWWRMGDDSSDSPVDAVKVASITDSTVNGYGAVQATASRQPTFSTDVPA